METTETPVRRTRQRPVSNAAPAPREDAEMQDIKSWLQSLGSTEMQVKVRRLSPKTYKGVNTEGNVGTYHEAITEEEIAAEHGGGTYQIVVHNRRANGSMQYVQMRRINIAGVPKLEGLVPDEGPTAAPISAGENGGLASQAMGTMQALLKEERAAKSNNGFDPRMIQMIQAPVMEQVAAMRESNAELRRALDEKDARIMALIDRKPDTSFQNDMIKNMWGNESSRLESLRAQHESEIRQLRAAHQDELSRARDQGREDLKDRSRGHEREIDAIKESMRAQIESSKNAYEVRIDGLKMEIGRLTAELAQAKGEIGELRAKKDKTIVEQANDIVQVQEAFKSLGVGGAKDEDDDSDKPWYERMATRVMENPEAIGQLIGGVRQNVAPPPQPQLPPPGQPFQGPDGKVYVTRPDGKVQRINPGVPAVKRARAAAAKAAIAEKNEGPKPPDPAELAIAIEFMESAFGNGTTPEQFAGSVRSMISSDIIAYIEKVGIDEILNKASLSPTSPLRNQAGRNWIRKVAEILLSGS